MVGFKREKEIKEDSKERERERNGEIGITWGRRQLIKIVILGRFLFRTFPTQTFQLSTEAFVLTLVLVSLYLELLD